MGSAQDEPHTSERGTSKWCVRHTSEDGRQSTHVASADSIFSVTLLTTHAVVRIPSVIVHRIVVLEGLSMVPHCVCPQVFAVHDVSL